MTVKSNGTPQFSPPISPYGTDSNLQYLFIDQQSYLDGKTTQRFSAPVGSLFDTYATIQNQVWFLTLANMNPQAAGIGYQIRATCMPAEEVRAICIVSNTIQIYCI